MVRHRRFGRVLAVGLLALTAASGCSRQPRRTKEQRLESGKRYAAQQKYAEAILEYRSAIQLDPRFGEARYALAQAYKKTNEPAKAAGEMIRAADLMPGNVAANLEAGQMLLLAGKFEDAKTRAIHVLELDQVNLVAMLLKSSAESNLKDFRSALLGIDDAVKADPKNGRTFIMKGAFEAERGRPAEAEASFKRAVELAPTSIDPLMALARFYIVGGRPLDAEGPLKRIVELQPRGLAGYQALAALYGSLGRESDTEASLKAIVDLKKDVQSRLELADYYAKTGHTPEAVALLKALASDKEGFAPATVRLAVLDYDQKRPADAYRGLDTVLAKYPSDPEVLATKGRLLLSDGKVDEALAAARAAVAANAKSIGGQNLLGTVSVTKGDDDTAIAAFNEVVHLQPDVVDARIQLARLQLGKGAVPTALQIAEEAVRLAPKDAAARAVLARALEVAGNMDRAEAILKDLVKDAPGDAKAHAQLGGLLLAKKDQTAARREFDRALELDSNSIEALRGRVAMDIVNKNNAGATAAIEKSLQKSPKQPDLLMLAAATYATLREKTKQEAMLRRLIEADPANLVAYVGLAQIYTQQGKLDEARAEYEGIAKRQPKSVMASTMVGVILEMQRKPAEARKVYEQVISRSPAAPLAANNLAWLYAEGGGNLDVALQLAQSAKRQLPNQPEVNDTLGWVYYKKDLASLAIDPLESAVAASPKDPTFRYHLGQVYVKMGNKTKAIAAFDEALKLKPDFREAQDARLAMMRRISR